MKACNCSQLFLEAVHLFISCLNVSLKLFYYCSLFTIEFFCRRFLGCPSQGKNSTPGQQGPTFLNDFFSLGQDILKRKIVIVIQPRVFCEKYVSVHDIERQHKIRINNFIACIKERCFISQARVGLSILRHCPQPLHLYN